MSTVLPKIRTHRGNIGNEVYVGFPDLSGYPKTYLSADEASGQTVLSVVSSEHFSNSTYVVIGTPGSDTAEIGLLTASGADTNAQLTISAAKVFAHPKGTQITFIPFNQIEISSASAIGGSYSVLATIGIQPDLNETFYHASTGAATVAYKVRFKNSTDTTYSDYSVEVLGSGYADNSVHEIIRRALTQLGEKIDNIITKEFLHESLQEGRRDFDRLRRRWSFRTAFNSDIGNMSEGGGR